MNLVRSACATRILVLAAGVFSSCAGPEAFGADRIAADKGELGIVDTALVIGNCGRFAGAVSRADLSGMLDGDGPFTVFVPVDEAFLSLEADQRRAVRNDPERLTEILLHHILEGEVRAPRLIHMSELAPVRGRALTVSIVDRQVMIDGARVVRGDVIARNGIIHFVDRVLLPETAGAPIDE